MLLSAIFASMNIGLVSALKWRNSSLFVYLKNSQLVGLRPPMWWTYLLASKHNAYRLNILLHLQLLWLHNAYHLKVFLYLTPFGHNLKGGFEIRVWTIIRLGNRIGRFRQKTGKIDFSILSADYWLSIRIHLLRWRRLVYTIECWQRPQSKRFDWGCLFGLALKINIVVW